jgi:hypothetical protein
MTMTLTPWPCPVCAALVPVGWQDCPYCQAPAAWIDQLLALDFTIRHFHYLTLTGAVSKPQYRLIVDACRQRRDEMVRAAQAGEPPPADTGLPSREQCWSCASPCRPDVRVCARCGATLDLPEVRLLRYRTYLCREIKAHEQAARLSSEQAAQLLAETQESLADVRDRLTNQTAGAP